MFTLRQAADYLNVSHEWVVKRINDRTFPYVRHGTALFIPESFVKRYIETRKERTEQLLNQLTAEAQELGLGY